MQNHLVVTVALDIVPSTPPPPHPALNAKSFGGDRVALGIAPNPPASTSPETAQR